MEVVLENASKKFYREWIFRRLNLTLRSGEHIAILGPNGSGKSTLLQVICGAVLPTEGRIEYRVNSVLIPSENIYREIALATPYLELIEEFTLEEIVSLHFRFKKLIAGFTPEDIITHTGLSTSRHKVFKYFSSGMKQRVKLALAFFSDVKLLLLDEPCSNLDKEGIKWYLELISRLTVDRLVVVCSNTVEDEFRFCTRQLQMNDFKK